MLFKTHAIPFFACVPVVLVWLHFRLLSETSGVTPAKRSTKVASYSFFSAHSLSNPHMTLLRLSPVAATYPSSMRTCLSSSGSKRTSRLLIAERESAVLMLVESDDEHAIESRGHDLRRLGNFLRKPGNGRAAGKFARSGAVADHCRPAPTGSRMPGPANRVFKHAKRGQNRGKMLRCIPENAGYIAQQHRENRPENCRNWPRQAGHDIRSELERFYEVGHFLGRPLLFEVLYWLGLCCSEQIRAKQAEVHQTCSRDSVVSPLGNGARCYFAKSSNSGGSAKRVNDVIRVHGAYLRQLRAQLQAI